MNGMILIIDDEPGTFGLHKVYFGKRHYGTEVINSVDEAIEFFKEPRFPVDCLIIDIMMPPGSELRDRGVKPGQAGYALIDWLFEQQGKVLGLARFADVPIAIYTQTDASVARSFMDELTKRSALKVSWNVWAKADSGPLGFVSSFLQWFESVRKTRR